MATALLSALLAASLTLNLYLWRRLRSHDGVPQYALDRINALSRKLDASQAKLEAAQQPPEPKP